MLLLLCAYECCWPYMRHRMRSAFLSDRRAGCVVAWCSPLSTEHLTRGTLLPEVFSLSIQPCYTNWMTIITEPGKLSPAPGHVLSGAVLSLAASLTPENTSLAQQSERIGLGWWLALTFVSGTKLEAAQSAGVYSSCVQLCCYSVACF